MSITRRMNGNTLEVSFGGQFTFAASHDFRDVLKEIDGKDIQSIVFDMGNVSFVDSAALGMLLLARDEVTKHGKKLVIVGAKGQVKKVLKVARFDQLFTLMDVIEI